MNTVRFVALTALVAMGLGGCNAGGGSVPTPTSTTVAVTNATAVPATIPGGVTSATPSALPSSSLTTATPISSATPISVASTTPTASATPMYSATPGASPTSAASAAPAAGSIPIFTPTASPMTNTSSVVSFTAGTSSSFSFGAFDGGTITVAWPTTGQISNVGEVLATGYNAFPSSLPTIAGATNVVALLQQQSYNNTSIPFLSGAITTTWTTHAGVPLGQWHIAYYSPMTDLNIGWHTAIGSSTINGDQVTIPILQPGGLGILAGSLTYFALYQ